MGFGEAVRTCFSKYATFSGRAPRSEYWWWVLFSFLGNLGLGILDGLIFGFAEDDPAMLAGLFGLATILPSIAVTARRLHDVNRSGWWQVAPYGMIIAAAVLAAMGAFILLWAAGITALVLLVALLVWLIRKGTDGPNDFGPDPLGGRGDPPDYGAYHRSSIPRAGRDD